MMKKYSIILLLILLQCLQISAQQSNFTCEITHWIKSRHEQLKSIESPLSFVGLLWLKEGKNTFGSASDNDLVLPKTIASPHAGYYLLEGDVISVVLEDKNILKAGASRVQVQQIPKDDLYKYKPAAQTIVLKNSTFQWFVINNKGKLGVRVFDSRSTGQISFKKVERFPADSTYRIPAVFFPYESVTYRKGVNVAGKDITNEALGELKFTLNNQAYSLETFESNGQFFIVFSDQTGLDDSYPFRFLYVPKAEVNGQVVIDFNKATNPNCAFSKFSFCPTPPEQNRLKIAIPAGEKKYELK